MSRTAETIGLFRRVNRSDLRPGVRILVINDVRQLDPEIDPIKQGTVIQLTEEPVRRLRLVGKKSTMMLSYSMVDASGMQCVTLLAEAVDGIAKVGRCTVHLFTRFLVPINGAL